MTISAISPGSGAVVGGAGKEEEPVWSHPWRPSQPRMSFPVSQEEQDWPRAAGEEGWGQGGHQSRHQTPGS